MPDSATQSRSKNIDPYKARTAANMADALSFLIQIAFQAGMRNVAVGLVGVRKELLAISAASDTSAKKQRLGRDHQDGDRLNRPN